MKKILSLCLALVMLLGMVAMTVSAEGEIAFNGYFVSLGDDISLNFSLTGLTPGQQYTVEVTDGNMGDDITVTADETGAAVAKYTGLTPAMLDTKFTATCEGATITKSVKDYCAWALTNMSLSNDVHTLIVNLLDYAAAAQAYTGAAVTANTWLNDLQKALAVTGDPAVNPNVPANGDNFLIVWKYVAPVLGDSVAYRYYFTLGTEGLLDSITFDVAVEGGESYTIQGSEAVATVIDEVPGYYVDFTALTPADLRKDVTITAKLETVDASAPKIFSAERYATYAAANENQATNNLINAILAYNKAAVNYNVVGETNAQHTVTYTHNDTSNLRKLSTGSLTASEIYRFSMLGGVWPSANNLPGSLVNTYAKVGVDISDIDDTWTASKKTLHWVYNYGVAKIVKGNAVTAGYENVETMYVEGSCFNNSGVVDGHQFVVADYQIGDVFCGKAAAGTYWSMIFLGRDENGVGKFLAVNSSKYSYFLYLDADKTLAYVTITAEKGASTNTFCGEATYTYGNDASYWILNESTVNYGYVLRPNNLAAQNG